MSLDAFKFIGGTNKWNNYSAIAAGASVGLLAVQSGWISNNYGIAFADNSFIYFMLLAIYLKQEARVIQSNLLINIGLEQLSKQKGNN